MCQEEPGIPSLDTARFPSLLDFSLHPNTLLPPSLPPPSPPFFHSPSPSSLCLTSFCTFHLFIFPVGFLSLLSFIPSFLCHIPSKLQSKGNIRCWIRMARGSFTFGFLDDLPQSFLDFEVLGLTHQSFSQTES